VLFVNILGLYANIIAIKNRGVFENIRDCSAKYPGAGDATPRGRAPAAGRCLEKVRGKRIRTPRPPRSAHLRLPRPPELEESPWFSRAVVSPPGCSCSLSRSPDVRAPAGSPRSTLPCARTSATTPSPLPRASPPARLRCQSQLCQGANSSTGCFALAFLASPCPQRFHLKPTHPRHHHSPVGCGEGMRNAGGVG
jgi:hypothetical protein